MNPPRKKFPALPTTFRTLDDAQRTLLETEHPDVVKDIHRNPGSCITCRGEKYFRWWASADRTEIVEYECPCEEQYIAHRGFLYSGIPLSFQRYSDADFYEDIPSRDDVIDSFLTNRTAYMANGIGMLFHGRAGTGKSLALYLLMKRMVADGFTGRAISSPQLVESYTRHWKKPNVDRSIFDAQILNPQILFIDDLGRERQGSGGLDQHERTVSQIAFEEVFRHRGQACLPTLVSTNIPPDSLISYYGQHTWQVLSERCEMVHFDGPGAREEARTRLLADSRAGLIRPVFYR